MLFQQLTPQKYKNYLQKFRLYYTKQIFTVKLETILSQVAKGLPFFIILQPNYFTHPNNWFVLNGVQIIRIDTLKGHLKKNNA